MNLLSVSFILFGAHLYYSVLRSWIFLINTDHLILLWFLNLKELQWTEHVGLLYGHLEGGRLEHWDGEGFFEWCVVRLWARLRFWEVGSTSISKTELSGYFATQISLFMHPYTKFLVFFQIDFHAPWLLDRVKVHSTEAWELVKQNGLILWQFILHYSNIGMEWLRTNVFV